MLGSSRSESVTELREGVIPNSLQSLSSVLCTIALSDGVSYLSAGRICGQTPLPLLDLHAQAH